MDTLDFLDAPEGVDEPVATPAAEAAPPAEAPAAESPPAEAAPQEQPRDPTGRFAPKADAEGAPERENTGRVPLGELLNERDKRKAAEARAAELEARLQPPPGPPDQFDDPEGHAAWQQQQQDARFQQLELARLDDKLNISERFARKEHGAELIEQAKAWGLKLGESNPSFGQRMGQDADPYEFLVTEFRRAQTQAALNDPATLDAFNQWRAAQAAGANGQPAGAQEPAAAAASQQPPSRPTRSIAGAPAAGSGKPGEEPVGPGYAFDGAIRG